MRHRAPLPVALIALLAEEGAEGVMGAEGGRRRESSDIERPGLVE